jgi:hypothetical protein
LAARVYEVAHVENQVRRKAVEGQLLVSVGVEELPVDGILFSVSRDPIYD